MTTWTVPVTGLSCDRCVQTVTERLAALDGIDTVTVEEHLGGTSQVTLTGATEVTDHDLQHALSSGGAFTISR